MTRFSDELIEGLCRVREDAWKAKVAFEVELRSMGGCKRGDIDHPFGRQCHIEYRTKSGRQQCSGCPVYPLFCKFMTKSNRAGAVLRALLRHGKHLIARRQEAEAEMAERCARENKAIDELIKRDTEAPR